MPLLLLLPLLILALISLWAMLLPFSLWARYRAGRARRRAQGWVVRANDWLLAFSVPLLLLSAWAGSTWVPHAVRDAMLGVLAGIVLGIVGLWLTRFEYDAEGFHFTPNRWLVLALTSLIAVRLAAGLWFTWRRAFAHGAQPMAVWLQADGWVWIGGVLLGYYLAYTWGLRARLPRPSRT